MSGAASMRAATSSSTAETLLQAGAPSSATCTDSPSHEATGNDAAAIAGTTRFDAVGIPEIAMSPDNMSAAAPGGATSDARAAEKSRDPMKQPLPEEIPEEDERLQPALEMVSILAHLAAFAILGVCIRFGLENLFGPLVAHVTDDSQSLFLDVPANMAGSFLMGIVGYTSKKDIAAYSQPLAIGLSTGLCGSITTYGSWNQRMVAIMAYGLVVRALFGYVLGTALAWHSFSVGVDAGEGLRELLRRRNLRQLDRGRRPWAPRPEHFHRRWTALVLAVGAWLLLWIVAALVFALGTAPKLRKLALGSLVGPFGCWLRWYLSFQNGKGVRVGGGREWLKWVPFGTLAANLAAVTLEAVTSAVDSVHNTATGSLIVGGMQLGFMGCLSTVSTLICEAHILTNAKAAQWRGYAYLYLATFLPSILIGICLYCVPVWVFGVESSGYNAV